MRIFTRSLPRSRHGFSLVELLLVIAIIALLMFLTLQAINPNKQLGSARNTQRKSDVNTIVNAVYQYVIDGNAMPSGIPVGLPLQICRTGAPSCVNGVDLTVITGKYIYAVPIDPQSPQSGTGTSYWIVSLGQNRLQVTAPLSIADGEYVEATR